MLNAANRTLGVRLDEATDHELELLAKERHQTKSDIARTAIRQLLNRERPASEWARQLARIEAVDAADPAMDDMIDGFAGESVADLPPAEIRR